MIARTTVGCCTILMLILGLHTPAESDQQGKPLVKGGIGDKPFIARGGSGTSLSGYTEVHFRYERENGITEEITFEAKRFNLFTYTPVSERVRVASELEFEEGARRSRSRLPS